MKENQNDKLCFIIDACRFLMMKIQHLTLKHIYREGNQVADHLAKKERLYEDDGLILVTKPSRELQKIILQDNGSLFFERTSHRRL